MPWSLKRQIGGSSLGAHCRWLLDHYVVDGGPSSCVSDKFSGAIGRGDQFDSDSDSDDEEHSEVSTPLEFQDARQHPSDDELNLDSDLVVAPASPPSTEQLSRADSKKPMRYEPVLNLPIMTRSDMEDENVYYDIETEDDTESVDSVYSSWPAGAIPLELFELITSHLTRAELKNLRLVCREFECKVSAQYFRNVVVPFRTEMYGNMSRDEWGTPQNPSSHLFSNGMRIFESFGPYILRFALSLEIDENSLSYPPLKPTQTAVTSFWGIYRWPHESYNRYTDLAGIEDTADQTTNMKKALSHLSKVSNMGLCCDAGLGFLLGPDADVRHGVSRQPVFATQDWRQTGLQNSPVDGDDVVTVADFNGVSRPKRMYRGPEDGADWRKATLRKMVMDAGYSESQVEDAVRLLMSTERGTYQDLDSHTRRPRASETREPSNRNHQATSDEIRHAYTSGYEPEEPGGHSEPKHPLIPIELTRGQKEMLLELEWAHRAMIQSYILSMIDNANLGKLNNLRTLTIAKIPSSHVQMFCRDDFWDSFPQLTNVWLGVIPDWRRISKPDPDCLLDRPVSPLNAVGKVYNLLQHIGSCPGIESLHFEWICGGEFAPSSFHRTQHILPVPFLPEVSDMTDPDLCVDSIDCILSMPHIKHLSLKNCWAAPHVFMQAIRQMALSSLEKLELETVSLSGAPTDQEQPPFMANPMLGHTHHQLQTLLANNPPAHVATWAQNALAAHPTTVMEQMSASIPPRPLMRLPNWFMWSGFIEHFSPTTKLRNIIEDSGGWATMDVDSPTNLDEVARFINRPHKLASDEKRYKLKCLSFKSCGYVSIEHRYIDTRSLLPTRTTSLPGPINHNIGEVGRSMQQCSDTHLARILQYIPDHDHSNLVNGFGMTTGWHGIYETKVINAAIFDGVEHPGLGRFTGVLQAQPDSVARRLEHDATLDE